MGNKGRSDQRDKGKNRRTRRSSGWARRVLQWPTTPHVVVCLLSAVYNAHSAGCGITLRNKQVHTPNTCRACAVCCAPLPCIAARTPQTPGDDVVVVRWWGRCKSTHTHTHTHTTTTHDKTAQHTHTPTPSARRRVYVSHFHLHWPLPFTGRRLVSIAHAASYLADRHSKRSRAVRQLTALLTSPHFLSTSPHPHGAACLQHFPPPPSSPSAPCLTLCPLQLPLPLPLPLPLRAAGAVPTVSVAAIDLSHRLRRAAAATATKTRTQGWGWTLSCRG